jgi:hypothetical protein
MTTQERDSLASLFDRLKLVERDPRDEATDKFVAQAVAARRRRRTSWRSSCRCGTRA